MRTSRRLTIVILVLGIGAVAGCNAALVGSWRTDPVPQGEKFYITTVTFKDDNTYTAAAKEGDQNVRLAGTYEFDGFHLKLKTPGKPDRSYGATVYMNRTLKLSAGDKNVTMKKQ